MISPGRDPKLRPPRPASRARSYLPRLGIPREGWMKEMNITPKADFLPFPLRGNAGKMAGAEKWPGGGD